MEYPHVHAVYNVIASQFDATRHSYWQKVARFLDAIKPYSVVLDIGCGNGKYQLYRQDLCWIANDMCLPLLHIASTKTTCCAGGGSRDYIAANALNLPYISSMCDAIISIAVLHHVSTMQNRVRFLKELTRVLRPGGEAVVSVWSADKNRDPRKTKKWQEVIGGEPGDYMIPWEDKNSGETHLRYYHLFTYDDILQMMMNAGVHGRIEYELDNWYIIIKKDAE